MREEVITKTDGKAIRRVGVILWALFCLGVTVSIVSMNSTLTATARPLVEALRGLLPMIMLYQGTFISTRYFKIALGFLGLFFIGAFMTLKPLPAADAILLIGFAGILVSYSIHFFLKRRKTFLDIIKVLTVLCLFPLPLWFFRPITADVKDFFILLGNICLAITFGLYLFSSERRKVS